MQRVANFGHPMLHYIKLINEIPSMNTDKIKIHCLNVFFSNIKQKIQSSAENSSDIYFRNVQSSLVIPFFS